ncbi:AAA family ATPase [Flavobacterium sp. UBA7663]|uniref:AAA family ATPase n=1 Tax=Flavobacterium sp. UBA7663 TaxID=1946557 RepID=UPI0025BC5B56|nr:AAA family ATPase [Flavobacterium sp. UBA7663]
MILSAIYIENHFLFEKPQIINFGGKYFFSILENGKISKEENKSYIPNFYNEDNVLLLSAIVGANGAGKTNILRAISQTSDERSIALIYEDENKILIQNKKVNNLGIDNFDFEEIDSNDKLYPLYYSPSIDYDIQDIFSPISPSRNFNSSLSEFYFDNLERQLFFLNSPKIDILKEVYPDTPFYSSLNVKVNNFNKSRFLNIYKDATLGKSLNKELEILWSSYKIESEMIHNDDDFLKNLRIMLFSLLVLDDTYPVTNNNGFEIGFEDVIRQNTFTGKLNKFLEKRICNIDLPTFNILKENYIFDVNNLQDLIDRIDRSKLKIISGGFDFESIKARMINCIKSFKAVNEFHKFVGNFDLDSRLKIENEKVFVEFKIEEQPKILVLIKEYEKLISVFKETIQHSNFRILNFYPDKKLSTGEKSLLDFFSSLYYFTIDKTDHQRRKENYLLLLDEPELGYHALWKKKFVNAITKVLPIIFSELDNNPKVQIIFTTHDALTLSDIANYNVTYIYKNSTKKVLSLSESKEKKVFGGNITDILADSFFVGDGLIGDFAKSKIQDLIDYINYWDKKRKNNDSIDLELEDKIKWISSKIVAKKVIEQIGEPYLNDKLNDMFLEVFPDFKNEEIIRLEEKIKKLKDDTNSNK